MAIKDYRDANGLPRVADPKPSIDYLQTEKRRLETENAQLREQLTDADNEIKGLVAKEIDLIAQIKRLDLARDQRDDLLEALKLITKYSLQEKVLEIARAAIARTEAKS